MITVIAGIYLLLYFGVIMPFFLINRRRPEEEQFYIDLRRILDDKYEKTGPHTYGLKE